MNTDSGIVIPAADSKLLSGPETHDVLNCSFEVLNELGHGLNKKLYENALTVEFRRRRIAYDQQRRFEVRYKAEYVGEFAPDLIAFGCVIIDTKVVDNITNHERGQMLNYLRICNLRVGLVVKFQTSETSVGTDYIMIYPCLFVSIRG
jgi:GxxExxY protein